MKPREFIVYIKKIHKCNTSLRPSLNILFYKKLYKIILTSKVVLLCSPLRDIVKLVLL